MTDSEARGTAMTEDATLLAELLAEFSPSCLVADAHPGVGVIGGWRSVDPAHRIAGPALTVEVRPDQLVDVLPVLELARPGDVVVIACAGATELAMWGGLMATLSRMAGIAGTVVDGAIRDVDELRALDWPAWFRVANPRRCPPAPPEVDPLEWMNRPVRVGGVPINPGDYVIADENGVSVVPPQLLGEVMAGVRRLLGTEARIRDRINAGIRLPQLLAEFGSL